MENKKAFTEPVCEITRFSVEDIMSASTDCWDLEEFTREIE